MAWLCRDIPRFLVKPGLVPGLDPDIIIKIIFPCDLYPLTPHFYLVKLGFTGVYIIFLFLLLNIDCGYSLEPPQLGGSNVYPQSMF